jgi:hypothetical protein
MSIAKQEFTNGGRTMLGRAQAGETLTISKIVVGSGVAAVPSDLWPLTAPIAQEMAINISTKRDMGNGVLLVEGSFRSDQAPGAFDLREAGVLAHIGAEADALYSIANVLATPPDHIDPAVPTVQVFKLKLIIDRIPTDDLIVQIGPSEAVTGENVGADTVGAGVYKEAAGNVLRFKRLVEGTGIDLTETPDTVTIAIRTLQVDLDLYVPPTHPAAPGPEVCFPSIQAAHDHLLQYAIPSNRFARINVDGGTFHHDGTTFTHPNSRQISLLGAARIDKAVTAINHVSATQKNVACDLTGLAVGMIVYLADCNSGWAGACRIISIGGSFVTCSVLNRSARPAYTVNDAGAGRRLSRFPSVLINDTPANNNLYFPNGIGRVERFTTEFGYAGFALGQTGTLSNVLAISCLKGVEASALVSMFNDCVAGDCDFGFTGPGLLYAPNLLLANGCTVGIAPAGQANVGALVVPSPGSFVYVNHCVRGVHAYAGANVRAGAVFYSTNDFGMVCEKGSVIVIGPYAGAPDNNGTDLYAQGMSYIEYMRNATVPTCNPAAGVIGNDASLIKVTT